MTDSVLEAAAPVIRLGGMDWEIPVLAVKQNRIAIPAFFKFMPAFIAVAQAAATRATDPMWFSKVSVTTADFDAMADAIYAALTRAKPGLARAEFDNLPVSLEEMFGALPVIAKQTGILKNVSADEALQKADLPGEAVAVEPE